MGGFRCVLISGPPGIGKTTAAHLVANLLGYNVLELNASDTRSKKLLEVRYLSFSSLDRRFDLHLLWDLISLHLKALSTIPLFLACSKQLLAFVLVFPCSRSI